MLWAVGPLTTISHILVFIDIHEAPPLQKPSNNHNDLIFPSKPLNLFPLGNTGHITLILLLNHMPTLYVISVFLICFFHLVPRE